MDWTSAVRESLRDAEVTPDSALWSRIEGSLDVAEVGVSVTPRRGYLWGVAVAIAAMLAIGLFVWSPQETTIPEIETEILAEAESDTEIEIYEVSEVSEPTELIEPIEERPTIIVEHHPIEEVIIAQATPSESEPTKKETKREREEQPRSKYQYNMYDEVETPRHTKRTELSLLYAGGVGGNTSNLATTSRQMAISSTLSADGTAAISLLDIYDSSNISHHQPFGIGLRLHRELTERLLIGSGLSYTRLTSEVKLSKDGSNAQQHIHLIGVPLHLKFRVVTHDRFSIYTGAGGTIERCIGAKVGSSKIDEREWHFSADVTFGAEYRLNRWAGLYIEPTLSHYFTQTHLHSIRNNSPTTFSLHIGVSFTL